MLQKLLSLHIPQHVLSTGTAWYIEYVARYITCMGIKNCVKIFCQQTRLIEFKAEQMPGTVIVESVQNSLHSFQSSIEELRISLASA